MRSLRRACLLAVTAALAFATAIPTFAAAESIPDTPQSSTATTDSNETATPQSIDTPVSDAEQAADIAEMSAEESSVPGIGVLSVSPTDMEGGAAPSYVYVKAGEYLYVQGAAVKRVLDTNGARVGTGAHTAARTYGPVAADGATSMKTWQISVTNSPAFLLWSRAARREQQSPTCR